MAANRVVEMQAFAGWQEPCAGLELKRSVSGEP